MHCLQKEIFLLEGETNAQLLPLELSTFRDHSKKKDVSSELKKSSTFLNFMTTFHEF